MVCCRWYFVLMDIKGVKPVASREKQTPFGAKTKIHFSGRTAPISVQSTQKSPTVAAPGTVRSVVAGAGHQPQQQGQYDTTALQPAPAVLTPMPEHKAFPLPRYEAPERPVRVSRGHRRRFSKRAVVLRGAAASFIIIATIGGLLAWNGYVKIHKVFHGASIVAALAPKATTPGVLSGASDGRINILLAGVSGTGGVEADLTDTVAVLSIDPVNNKAVLLNIPTDLWVQQQTSFTRQQELNAVYSTVKAEHTATGDASSGTNPGTIEAGLEGLDQVVEQVTGVPIDYHLLVNFQAFQQAVDAVGGVTINAPAKLYDPSLAWKNHVSPDIATAGMQQMDGSQALLYVRSRVTADGSSQVLRELQVLAALKDKALSAGTLSDPSKIEALINSVGDNAYSDLNVSDAGELYTLIGKIDDDNINSIDLNGPSPSLLTAKRVGGLTVAVPTAGTNSYADIQEYVRGYMASGKVVNEHAPVTVISSDAAGAAISQSMLKSYGINVTTATTTNQQVSHLTLVNLSSGDDPSTLHFLEEHYGVKSISEMPTGITVPPGSAKFVIIEP